MRVLVTRCEGVYSILQLAPAHVKPAHCRTIDRTEIESMPHVRIVPWRSDLCTLMETLVGCHNAFNGAGRSFL